MNFPFTLQEALKELRSVVKWLEANSPSAARSLEEGLEETLTLHELNINELLRRSLSSTNYRRDIPLLNIPF